MAEDRVLSYGSPLPPAWLAALQEFIGTAAVNFHLSLADAHTVQVVAGPDSAQVGIGIDGLFRYISSTANSAITGSAGQYDVFVVCGPNNIVLNPSPPPPELDETVYAFALQVLPHGTTPTLTGTTTNFRKVGEVGWDGAKIVQFRSLVGDYDAVHPITATSPTPNVVAARAVGATSQAVPIATWETAAGTVVASVDATGHLTASALTVSGTTALAAFTASGNGSVGGTLSVGGATTLASFTATVNGTIDGYLTITGQDLAGYGLRVTHDAMFAHVSATSVGTASLDATTITSETTIASKAGIYPGDGVSFQSSYYLKSTVAPALGLLTNAAFSAVDFYASGAYYGGANGAVLHMGSGNQLTFFWNGSNIAGFVDGTLASFASDARMKRNIADFDDALKIVNQLQGRTFQWKPGGAHDARRKHYGLIAQEVREVFPEGVQRYEVDDDEFLGLEPLAFTPLLVEAIKELTDRVEQLESRLAAA